MFQWFTNAYEGLKTFLTQIYNDTTEFITDLPVSILAQITDSIASSVEAIAVPSFLVGGIGFYLSGIDPAVLYFLDMSGFDAGIALLGSGLAFRLLRKTVTLGQW